MKQLLRLSAALLSVFFLSACGGDPGGGTDTTKPVITLKGNPTVTLNVGETYTDAGASASDNVDGNITDKIAVYNPVNTREAGTYTVTYDVNDSAGNAADQVTRTVTVQAPNASPIASATATPTTATQGDTITFDGSGSNDSDGSIVSYEWKEGSIVLSTQQSFTTSSLAVGTHSITLTVTDNDGASASVSVTIEIAVVTPIHLKKTGQTKSYDENGSEVTNGSIKDDGYYQKGATPSYTRDDAKEIVTDNITGLQWQDDTNASSVTKSWAEAKTYCENLTLGDFTDWKLPTVVELQSIVVDGAIGPSIDTTAFDNHTSSDPYWSSTPYASDADQAWAINFYYGDTSDENKINTYYVRCVR